MVTVQIISDQTCHRIRRFASKGSLRMHFDEDQLTQIEQELDTIKSKYTNLVITYVHREYKNNESKEYAIHGFSRRMRTLFRSINNVFEILPPALAEIPSSDGVADAVINIHAFVLNIFGCTDNLAWIWVKERALTRNDGQPIPNTWVGLGKSNTIVRQSFSAEFRSYLEGLDNWFEYLENYRHSLAHRIPLYIPPYTVSDKYMDIYKELEEKIASANRRFDFHESERLLVEQMKLAVFSPIMTHSFSENAKPVIFHAQLIADFNTINEIGNRMISELDRL